MFPNLSFPIVPMRYPYPVHDNAPLFVTVRLKTTNLLMWEFQIINLIELQVCLWFIDGTIKSPPVVNLSKSPDHILPNPEFLAWKQTDGLIKGCYQHCQWRNFIPCFWPRFYCWCLTCLKKEIYLADYGYLLCIISYRPWEEIVVIPLIVIWVSIRSCVMNSLQLENFTKWSHSFLDAKWIRIQLPYVHYNGTASTSSKVQ